MFSKIQKISRIVASIIDVKLYGEWQIHKHHIYFFIDVSLNTSGYKNKKK